MSQQEYIDRAAEPEKKRRLELQWSTAVHYRSIKCVCGQLRALELAYRCLYCGEWFCFSCAERHFGQTVDEWIREKRIEKRRELEATT